MRPARYLGAALLVLAFVGCLSTMEVAPPVTAALVGASRGSDAATLNQGRQIFTGVCANCHAPDPIERHSLAEWRLAVDEMAPRAKLDAERKAALLAYLTAAKAVSLPAPMSQ